MFEVVSEEKMGGLCRRYEIFRDGEPLSYSEVFDLWQRSEPFRSFFTGILAEAPFAAYRWETPPVRKDSLDRIFEFVLIDASGLGGAADSWTFREFYRSEGEGVVVFENLGRDALMVVPSPRAPDRAYRHLATFVREAPEAQVHALWRAVGEEAVRRISDRPLWISTTGDGVAWLHVRLDSSPKYYVYSPYV